ncbi:PREDICTED: serine/threonine-protein kinase-like protein At1g28390 [Tarenaya hassleriana]|uniref:serine/threonine-protein kinase-like protein At1g28390 n=1 Tax=Tarenaya hassleriana TaxID=28532 RepID=UPI00053C5BF8|nr:PREDICTED: serine/threonine-protein kinase-like protein At1g28390 [Tarenaya hassleriana]
MGYLSCNAESAIAACDPYNWDRRRRLKHCRKNPTSADTEETVRRFTFDELAAATNGFSADNFLGKGSYGSVYKAVLDGGKLIAAVKRTSAAGKCIGGGGDNSQVDHEIEILSRIKNPRLVNLIGFCVDQKRDTKLLVFEFMPNGSLHEILHRPGLASKPASWNRRMKHALQVARAVHALHSAEPPVIHRDVKSSNVLIDGGGNARLGDFGLALSPRSEDERVKRTPPAGTIGYLDPSYLAPADLTVKSDVFSFGILLLEIISGRNAIDLNYSPSSVVDWALPLMKRGDYAAVCDPIIAFPPPPPAAVRAVCVLAARCVRSTVEKRPEMSEAVECLKQVRRLSHVPRVWNNLRQRVRRVELSEDVFVLEESQEKVSTVAQPPEPPRPLRRRNRVMRSRSVGPEPCHVEGEQTVVVIRSLVAGKSSAATARLRKSRSTGILRSCHNKTVKPREFDVTKVNNLSGHLF